MSMVDFDWTALSELAASALRLEPDEKDRLASSKAARLVAALPYAAGCSKPERLALAHLATFWIASTGPARSAFDHTPEDDASYLTRLAPIVDHPSGDPAVVEAGMARLALMMLAGYERDMAADAVAGQYNPLNAGAWDLEEARAALREAAESDGSLDTIVSAQEAEASWWQL